MHCVVEWRAPCETLCCCPWPTHLNYEDNLLSMEHLIECQENDDNLSPIFQLCCIWHVQYLNDSHSCLLGYNIGFVVGIFLFLFEYRMALQSTYYGIVVFLCPRLDPTILVPIFFSHSSCGGYKLHHSTLNFPYIVCFYVVFNWCHGLPKPYIGSKLINFWWYVV